MLVNVVKGIRLRVIEVRRIDLVQLTLRSQITTSVAAGGRTMIGTGEDRFGVKSEISFWFGLKYLD